MRMPKLMQAKNYLIPRPLRCKGLPLYRPARLQVEWLTLIATLLTAKNQTHSVTVDFQYHNITILVIWDFLCLLYNLLFEDLNASIHTFDFVSLTHLWLLISNTITVTWDFFSVFCFMSPYTFDFFVRLMCAICCKVTQNQSLSNSKALLIQWSHKYRLSAFVYFYLHLHKW